MPRNLNVGDVVGKLYELLKDLDPSERLRVVQAALTLFGESADALSDGAEDNAQKGSSGARANRTGAMPNSEQDYFAAKQPRNKGEELAVAARFLEQTEQEETYTREDLKRVIGAARRNFDVRNFSRDITNATNQAGFFNRGTGRGKYKLSYYGQQYVDALPDRDKAKKARRPGRKSKTGKKAKRKSASKS